MAKISTYNTERLGVSAIEHQFQRMGWVFREREHTDMGIDADVEQKIGNTLTSQHIALQIKSGQSYLKENKDGKIYFYIDSWHYKYWLQSDRPVLILFYDDVLDRIIWEQVCLTHLNRISESKTRITISPSRSLNAHSEELLNDIIASYSPHHFYDLDKSKVTFEHSIFYRQELSDEFETVLKDFTSFRNRINNITAQNVVTVPDIFDSLTNKLKPHLDLIYKDFHLSNWYFDKLIQSADSSLLDKVEELVDEYLRNFQQNINIWKTNVSDFMRLKKPGVPQKAIKSMKRCSMVVLDYIGVLELAIEELNEQKTHINTRRAL